MRQSDIRECGIVVRWYISNLGAECFDEVGNLLVDNRLGFGLRKAVLFAVATLVEKAVTLGPAPEARKGIRTSC